MQMIQSDLNDEETIRRVEKKLRRVLQATWSIHIWKGRSDKVRLVTRMENGIPERLFDILDSNGFKYKTLSFSFYIDITIKGPNVREDLFGLIMIL